MILLLIQNSWALLPVESQAIYFIAPLYAALGIVPADRGFSHVFPMYFVPHALRPLHMLRALTWITLCLIWLDGFPTFVSYKLAWWCIYFGNQPVLCKSMSLILQERDIKGSVSVSNNEDKYLYFHNFWTSFLWRSAKSWGPCSGKGAHMS